MEDLVKSMISDNPASRPRIEEVLKNFVPIQESLGARKLRSPITPKKLPKKFGVF